MAYDWNVKPEWGVAVKTSWAPQEFRRATASKQALFPRIGNHVELTGDIVSAYVTANNIQRSELPGLIADVHSALTNLGKPASEFVKAEPPVPIKQTIKPDYIISLEDGRRYKSMKRHLRAGASRPNNIERNGVFAPTTRWSRRITQRPAPNSQRAWGWDRFGRDRPRKLGKGLEEEGRIASSAGGRACLPCRLTSGCCVSTIAQCRHSSGSFCAGDGVLASGMA